MTTIVGDPLYRPFGPDRISGDSSWQAIQQLFERASTNAPELIRELEQLGTPTALEIEGLVEARAGDNTAALETFDRAARAYPHGPENFRCVLHQADLLQSLKRDEALAELIKKAWSRFTDDASKRILRSYQTGEY
jgi:hypothetical protein